jgi:hypothetical protein
MNLSAMFDGEEHWLELDEHFLSDGATKVIDGWEELEEEDVLSPFESPSATPILRDTGRAPDPRFPHAQAEQAWGAFSISLTALANICQFEKKQYQHVYPGQKSEYGEIKWSFQTNEFINERM